MELVEKSIADGDKNELISGKKNDDLMFFNRDLKIHYEKIPLMSKRKKVGFLLYCTPDVDNRAASPIPGIDIKSKSLDHIADAVERLVLVDLLRDKNDLAAVAKSLKITHKSLAHKIKKHGINWKKEV